LNVVALFNGTIPLIAIQMHALKVGDHTTLVFTKVMDELSRGLVDEDEDAEAAPTDRAYWEKTGTKTSVQLADELLTIAHEIDPSLEPRLRKLISKLLSIQRDQVLTGSHSTRRTSPKTESC
jgi:hypothetical protein